MPGSIQSIERAAAVLRLLAGVSRPVALHELASALDLPRPTVHGIVRTLRQVGFAEQDEETAGYVLGAGWAGLRRGHDRHDVRAAAMNWADALAGGTGLAVFVGVPDQDAVLLVHHVFRPDGTAQQLRTGERLPLHATALGKCLLAFAPLAAPRPDQLTLTAWTGRTCVTGDELAADLAVSRARGWAGAPGDYVLGTGAVAAPMRVGGPVVGALAVSGPVEEIFTPGGAARPQPVAALLDAARAIERSLDAPW